MAQWRTTRGNRFAEGPLVLFFDGLHNPDEGSIDLCEFLATKAASMPLVLVGTCRSGGFGAAGHFESCRAGRRVLGDPARFFGERG